MLSVSPGISNQLFAAIDADKGDDTNQNHCAGGAEADDVFQILRAIFFETHFFVSTVKFFPAAKLVMCVLSFLRQTEKRVRVIFYSGYQYEKYIKFLRNFWRQSFNSSCRSRGRRPSVRLKKTAQSWKVAVPP